MNREYYKPEAVMAEMFLEPLMAVISGELGNIGIDSGAFSNTPDLLGKKCGEWGNLCK